MAYDAIDIANEVLANTDTEHGETISNLKLQKMLYYLQGFFIAALGRPLFDDPIVAWQYGPVVPRVYHHFKHLGQGAIPPPTDHEPLAFSENEESLFAEVLEEYGQFSAIKLMKMTHQEKPWQKTFSEKPQGEIDRQLLAEHFKTMIED